MRKGAGEKRLFKSPMHVSEVPAPARSSAPGRRRVKLGRSGLVALLAPLSAAVIAAGALLPAGASLPAPALVPIAGAVPVSALPLPAAIDNASFYEKQTRCDSVARPGATKLGELLQATYGPATVYITRSCTSNISEHFDGRAVDWMRSVRVPAEAAQVDAMLNFLLSPGADGSPQEMMRRLGIMYIIWNNKMIRAYDPGRGWTEYQGCSARPAASLDNACHRNHVHFSLSWDGAAANTSWWTGAALTAPYCSAGTAAATPGAGTPQVVTDLAAVAGLTRVDAVALDTASGVGVPAACRLLAGRPRPIDLLATGALGSQARVAALSVTVHSNAPTTVALWSSGRSQPAGQISADIGRPGQAVILVPLSAVGTVGIATTQGAANVTVRLVGYLDSDLPGPAAPIAFSAPASRLAAPPAPAATPGAPVATPAGSPAVSGSKPSAPRQVKASSAKKTVTIRWSAPAKPGSHPVTSYRVAALRNPRQPNKVAGSCSTDGSGRRCQIKGLKKGATYWISVRATNAVGSTWAAKKKVRVK